MSDTPKLPFSLPPNPKPVLSWKQHVAEGYDLGGLMFGVVVTVIISGYVLGKIWFFDIPWVFWFLALISASWVGMFARLIIHQIDWISDKARACAMVMTASLLLAGMVGLMIGETLVSIGPEMKQAREAFLALSQSEQDRVMSQLSSRLNFFFALFTFANLIFVIAKISKTKSWAKTAAWACSIGWGGALFALMFTIGEHHAFLSHLISK